MGAGLIGKGVGDPEVDHAGYMKICLYAYMTLFLYGCLIHCMIICLFTYMDQTRQEGEKTKNMYFFKLQHALMT